MRPDMHLRGLHATMRDAALHHEVVPVWDVDHEESTNLLSGAGVPHGPVDDDVAVRIKRP